MTLDELKKAFNISDFNSGLSTLKAEKLLTVYGKNTMHVSYASFYVAMFKNLLNGFTIYLTFIFSISIASIFITNNDRFNTTYYAVLSGLNIFYVTVQVCLVFYQVRQSIASTKAINALVSTNVVVIRDGLKVVISSHELVVGDVVLLSTNDKICADLRLVETRNLRLDKSALTGESEPVDTSLSVLHQDERVKYLDATNMAFANSVVVFGSGKGLVVATGKDVLAFYVGEFKKSRNMLNYQRELSRLAIFVLIVTILLLVVYTIEWAAYIRVKFVDSFSQSDLLLSLSSIITCFVPFTLPIALTISLYINVRQLRKSQVLVKNMGCFEASSAMSVLATDKTATLTQNTLHVTNVLYGFDRELPAEACFYDMESCVFTGAEAGVMQVLASCYLCNAFKHKSTAQNSMDLALGQYAERSFQQASRLDTCYTVLHEIDFSSMNKYHVKMFEVSDVQLHGEIFGERENAATATSGHHLVLVKGAPDLLRFKTKWTIDAQGRRVELDRAQMKNIIDVQNSWSSQGKRVVMLCKKYVPSRLAEKVIDFDKFFKTECNDLVIIG
jgi:sodium/potassium-transporting ATPase subunit alpha